MKKNVIMRAACVVLVLTLLSTCMISGTFAKYVTDAADVSDNARVAKWGVDVAVKADELFADAYKSVGEGNVPTTYTANETETTLTVQASAEDVDVVAPGTKGSVTDAIEISGTPEVDVEVEITADVELTGWTVDGAFYCPVVFTVTPAVGEPVVVKQDVTNDSAEKLAAALEKAITDLDGSADGVAYYHTNTDLGAKAFSNVDIAWEWAFNGDDAKDTALGDAAADTTAATISITYGATVTQVD